MKPIIALVGRPNVGKSTLFNFLINKREALVGKYLRLTRDRKYGKAKYSNIEFTVIDTGGIDGHEKYFEQEVAKQSFTAIKESNIVFLIMDGRIGLTHEDIKLYNDLRSKEKDVFIVVNKTEGIDSDIVKSEFYSLGSKNLYTISASNGLGINVLIKIALSRFLKKYNYIKLINENLTIENNEIKISIIGSQNSGKSTLINNFIEKNRLLANNIPGTTRENICIPFVFNKNKLILIDTAGIYKQNKKNVFCIETLSRKKTFESIKKSDILILVIDAKKSISANDLSIIQSILNKGKFFTIVINKCDLFDKKEIQKLKKDLFYRLNFIKFIPIYFVSAFCKKQINLFFKNTIKCFFYKNKKIQTNIINKIMKTAVDKYQPPFVQGRRIKLKYAHIGNYNPYTIIIHGNQLKSLSKHYKSYLTNCFYHSLNIQGTPIKLSFKNNINPFLLKNK